MSFLFPGGPIPLFDKLDQRAAPLGHEAGQGLSAEGVEVSVAQELRRLLNSRSGITLSQFADAPLTVLDYGIPDYTALSAQSDTECALIANAIRHAISHFEPRLFEVNVTPISSATGRTIALFHIEASLRIAQTIRRIQFTLSADEYATATPLPSKTEPEIA